MKNFAFFLKSYLTSLFLLVCLPGFAQMNEAYELAGKMVRERLQEEDPENIEILDNLNEADIIVVDGTYDHIHLVLTNMKVPFVRIRPAQVLEAKLLPHHTVFVNCASSFPREAALKLADFVASGGQLITTDWALKQVLEVAFPNTVAYNGKSTGDEVISIELPETKDPMVAGFVEESTHPVWWLEGSSYPIKVLDEDRVEILVRSRELKTKYGEEGVIIRFQHGRGRVYHMISHFYLQRSESRDNKQKMSAAGYLKEKKMSDSLIKESEKNTASYGEVQSANTSTDFVSRVIIDQARRKKDAPKKDKKKTKN